MSSAALLSMALAVLGFAVVSGRLRSSPVSSAMVFVAVGALLGVDALGWIGESVSGPALEALTTATLVLVLFGDASQIQVRALRAEARIPIRLLSIGLPLTILVGLLAGVLLLPELLVVEALLLAVILAPTDAALGQAVVVDERLPLGIRQGLNVESGLNDGICVPLLAVAITFADVETGASASRAITQLVEEIGWGVVAGVAAGVLISLVLRVGGRRVEILPVWRPLVAVAGATMAYALAVELGGSGFIAAFVGGLTFRIMSGERALHDVELVEEGSSLLAAATFMLFGAIILVPVIDGVSWRAVVYALVSLTVVRMGPVALSMVRSRMSGRAVLLMGWFGPRGLASIVFVIITLEAVDLPHATLLTEVAALTVLASVLLHGISAVGLVDRFVRAEATAAESAAEAG